MSEFIEIFMKSAALEELEFSNPGGSLEPHRHFRKKIVERGILITFNEVDFLGIPGKWTGRLQEFVHPPGTHEFADLHDLLAHELEFEYE